MDDVRALRNFAYQENSSRGIFPRKIIFETPDPKDAQPKRVARRCNHAAQKFMPSKVFPESVRQLVFEHIDSVEQLDVLIFMRTHRDRAHDNQAISAELRSNPQSVINRLNSLAEQGFLKIVDSESEESPRFQYAPVSPELDDAIAELEDLYRVRPHKVLELIFSPLKKGRQFADAFLVTPSKKESENG